MTTTMKKTTTKTTEDDDDDDAGAAALGTAAQPYTAEDYLEWMRSLLERQSVSEGVVMQFIDGAVQRALETDRWERPRPAALMHSLQLFGSRAYCFARPGSDVDIAGAVETLCCHLAQDRVTRRNKSTNSINLGCK